MLEAKNDNKDRNDIDIKDNTSGTVGFDPKTGRVFYVDEPKKEEPTEVNLDKELAEITDKLSESTDSLIGLLKEAGIEDPTDLDAIKKLAEDK
ncbi:hypothetical protein [uncultured Anaerococcus sp.]|uniref:hypothetical protein n=1 Tax=uncultured Anaerococcus sp. TaxID=293428 RepID=UPI00288C4939|nr:hypothetical protein [uncultured Anaerococcus sp.]